MQRNVKCPLHVIRMKSFNMMLTNNQAKGKPIDNYFIYEHNIDYEHVLH